ncbi:pyridoxamine 5'-phosphate oxidase family protein [Nocardiopsis ansamitocini]|uniref:Pyridoxamine 5'-phosphate oxidase N-terminal domain-containing protein n=1 Tax=Nocardiopsis ansamitocini TaxID=1670832 RepID=A0A9W6UJJ6_9ACTN|nr:pyridoxamine 5'-phosphate oxidase family protein [Nocardiopsis ansamitocini]GLU48782.1 hypothetical protein Nans01_31330 [Nocardiopsis ansamitocini]
MANLDDVRALIEQGGNRGVVSTTRADGSIQSSLVVAGIVRHPVTAEEAVAFTTPASSVKLRFLRQRPRATMVFQSGYHWASVEGTADLIGYDDAYDGVDAEMLGLLLRAVFVAAGGTHDDWDSYDHAMIEERRSAVLISPARVFAM